MSDSASLLYHIDLPAASSLGTDASIEFAGWVFAPTGESVNVRVRAGQKAFDVPCNVDRPDVLAAFQIDPPRHCGFGFWINMQEHQFGARVEIEFHTKGRVLRLPPYLLEYTGARRSQYQAVWNSLTDTEERAKLVVAGLTDEGRFAYEAERTKRVLLETVGITETDVVLEIGAGVGRVGAVIAPLCKEWIGTDVSEQMLAHMTHRLAGLSNVRAIPLN